MNDIQTTDIEAAKQGDAKALETLVRGVQGRIYRLALRMLVNPAAAQDATQEILIRIVTKLSTFREDSRFETWVYRVATNYLLTARKIIANDPDLSFQAFGEDLLGGLVDEAQASPEDHIMLNELRLRCTMAMLLCLDPPHRAAYVLGEIIEFDHAEAAEALDISPGSFRKRLSRARSMVQAFTVEYCGLADTKARCTCRKRLPAAVAMGRVGTAPSAEFAQAPTFAEVEAQALHTQASLVAAKLQRATGPLTPLHDYAAEVLEVVNPPGQSLYHPNPATEKK
ncbi:RNA polymerase sigma factor [Hydrogenophaga sp. 5NK40-0174]|uniref:RNA polymerase sigma factor n=1 Tax=Hydrogenophaga sp. 5NK40-0174 TaxID=3127649 RepID=UPI003104977E